MAPTADSGGSRGRGRFLTPDAIVDAARRLVENEGLDGLTIRKITAVLGATPMAMYRHFPEKRALLQAMLDEVAASIPQPPRTGTPREQLVAVVLAVHNHLRANSWAIPVLREGTVFTARHVEHVLTLLQQAGLGPEAAVNAYSALWWLTLGHLSVLEASAPERGGAGSDSPLAGLPPAMIAQVEKFDHDVAYAGALHALVDGLLG